ncbi:MAG: hypothetical protein GY772_22895, partial [bacterium]|nr:hypothetical protein [bacterium]
MFKGTQHIERRTYLILEENSLARRRQLQRGSKGVHQLEYMTTVTKEGQPARKTPRAFFPGSTMGDCLGPVVLPAWEHAWQMTLKAKRVIYGRCRVAVGGSLGPAGSDGADGSGDDDDEHDGGEDAARALPAAGLGRGKDTGRRDDTVEPLCSQQLPKVLYQELLHSCAAKAVYDLTVGDGTFLLACVERKVPCVGLCYTE